MRVIFDNGTESNLLYRSFQKAMCVDETARQISNPDNGPIFNQSEPVVDSSEPETFSDTLSDDDIQSGTIYVLRSNSEDEFVKTHREIIHKIGVTGGSVAKRIANAKLDPTFLMADVEVISTYELSNINRVKFEGLIHRFLESAKLEIQIKDRFNHSIIPREWFLVPLYIIDEMIERFKNGSIVNCEYDKKTATIVQLS